MEWNDLENLRDSAAAEALSVRARIEAGVNSGELPAWVLEACERWENSSLLYGAATAQLNLAAAVEQRPVRAVVH